MPFWPSWVGTLVTLISVLAFLHEIIGWRKMAVCYLLQHSVMWEELCSTLNLPHDSSPEEIKAFILARRNKHGEQHNYKPLGG